MSKWYLGIDPDVKGVGLCLYNNKTGIEALQEKSFFDTIAYIDSLNELYETITVVIESSWLKNSTWVKAIDSQKYTQTIAMKVGRNHQVGILLEEYCIRQGIKYRLKTPSNAKKYTITRFRQITKYKGKVTQDMVDAAMLVYGY